MGDKLLAGYGWKQADNWCEAFNKVISFISRTNLLDNYAKDRIYFLGHWTFMTGQLLKNNNKLIDEGYVAR